MNRPGFILVHHQGIITLEIYGRQTTSASRFTSYYQSSSGVAVFLGRLFYRQDLLDRLGLTQLADHSSVFWKDGHLRDADNDAALVMIAYERWGRDAFTRLEGDFAIAIYDARERCLIGLRDTLGGYPLYYTSGPKAAAIGTYLGALTRLLPGAVVSRNGLADYLVLRTFGFHQPDSDASIFEGIDRVRVGQVVRLNPSNNQIVRSNYWDWSNAATSVDVPEDPLEAIYEKFAGLLREAVRERCTETTATQLSGGMDSTSVALLAAELLSGHAPVHAISLIYERWNGLALETPFIREALDACPTLASHLLLADNLYDFDQFPTPPPTDEPWPGLYHITTEAAMLDTAAAVGANSMLTGFGGDEVADLLPFNVADRLREGRLRVAWQLAAQWAAGQNQNVWNVFKPYGLMPLVPAPLRGGLRTFFRRGRARWQDLDDCWIPPWVRPDFARKHDLYDRVLCELCRASSFDSSLQRSESLYMITSRNGDMIRWYLGAPRGIHTGNPFLDPRVIRYGLAARTHIPFHTGRQKPLLANAMRGVLPDSIRNRRHKGNFNEPYFIGLSRSADYLEAMIENAPVDDLECLDKEVLLQCFRDYRMARVSNGRTLGRMTIILAILNWLTHYQDWIHDIPPADQILQWSTDPSTQTDSSLSMSPVQAFGGSRTNEYRVHPC